MKVQCIITPKMFPDLFASFNKKKVVENIAVLHNFFIGCSAQKRILRPACFLLFSLILFPGGDAAPDMPFRLVLLQDLFDLKVQRLVEGGQALRQILVHSGLGNSEFGGGGTYRRFVLYDVKGQFARALFDVPFQPATLPAIQSPETTLCREWAGYEIITLQFSKTGFQSSFMG